MSDWGSNGKCVTCYGIRLKFCPRVRLKPSYDCGEFEIDWERCNKNITENSLGHETDST